MRYANDLDRMQETIRAALTGIVNREEFTVGDWLDPKHRCGDIIRMMKKGASDEAIKKKYSGMSADVLAVYHRIADGTMDQLAAKARSEKDIEKAKKREKQRKAAYMEKYGKGR